MRLVVDLSDMCLTGSRLVAGVFGCNTAPQQLMLASTWLVVALILQCLNNRLLKQVKQQQQAADLLKTAGIRRAAATLRLWPKN